MSRRTRLPALALAGLVLAGCAGTNPGDGGSAAAPAPADSSAAEDSAAGESPAATAPATAAGRQLAVEVAGGAVSGDTGRVPVDLGEQVTLAVTSDAADELHLHGYDLTAELQPGAQAVLTFTADISGVFEVELHEAGTVLLSLQVG
ncbi:MULTISPECIES: hypothetical protein [unclassified Blastococcus]